MSTCSWWAVIQNFVFFVIVIMCWDCSIPVFIKTDPTLVDDSGSRPLQCDNSTITLTCEANVTFGEPIYQWLSSLDYETFDEELSVIEVELRSYPVNYSCVVTDGYIIGYANITIVSNGKHSMLDIQIILCRWSMAAWKGLKHSTTVIIDYIIYFRINTSTGNKS